MYDYHHPDDHIPPTYEVTPELKTFTVFIVLL